MVTRSELFPSRFINAANLERPMAVTIEFAKKERLENLKGESEDKLVVYFNDCKQNLACNATNLDSICNVTGQYDSDNWGGHKIELYRDQTRIGGKTVPCVRVRAVSPSNKSKQKRSLRHETDDEIAS
jgi:hypothetical protein